LHGDKVAADYELSADLEDFYKFVLNDVAGALSHEETTFEDIGIYHYGAGRSIFALSLLAHSGAIRKDQAKQLLKEVLQPEHIGVDLEVIVQNTKALDEADTGALDAIVKQVLANNQKAVQEYLGGKDKAIGAIMGQVMRQMKADPQLVTETIKRLIAEN
jgi:aspartyl-tRNA(Asn)/glutamyl-tRNA(Gln) amidotransferase subunit B